MDKIIELLLDDIQPDNDPFNSPGYKLARKKFEKKLNSLNHSLPQSTLIELSDSSSESELALIEESFKIAFKRACELDLYHLDL